MLFNFKRISRTVLLVAGAASLSACTLFSAPAEEQKAVEALHANQLQAAYDATLLAHRTQGAIAPHSFETQVRTEVRNQQNLDLNQALNTLSEDELHVRLTTLDNQLNRYKHASHKGSEFQQLWSLLPSLPVLEERKAVKLVLSNKVGAPVTADGDRQAYLTDLQLNKLFNSFVISVDALTPETEVFENALIEELKQQGLNISARRPSLILQYFIEMSDAGQGKEVIGDFELKDRSAKLFQSLSTELTASASESATAENVAIKQIADQITRLMLSKTLERINAVNQYQ